VAAGTSGSTTNIASISIPNGGTWQITLNAYLQNQSGGTISAADQYALISATTASATPVLADGYDKVHNTLAAAVSATGANLQFTIPPVVVTTSAASTYYFNSNITWSTAAPKWTGAWVATCIG
jgi:hypothetical protein